MPWIGHYTVINPPCFMAFEPLNPGPRILSGYFNDLLPNPSQSLMTKPTKLVASHFSLAQSSPQNLNFIDFQAVSVSLRSCWRNTTLRTMCHLPVDPYLVGSCLVSSAMAGVDKKSRCQPVHVSLLSCCLRLLSTVKEHMKRVHVSLHKLSCTFLVQSLLKTNTQKQFLSDPGPIKVYPCQY